MNKSELIENLANTSNIGHNKSEEIVDIFFDNVASTLSKGGRVEIRGFGALSVKKYESYTGRNPKTGHKIQVDAKILPIWRTGLELKKRVDAPSL